MIKIDKVSKTIGSFSLKNLSFELPSGYICGLIGENGAGKTTLLHILAGLYSYDEGEVRIFQNDYHDKENEIKQDIGAVFHGDLFETRDTLIENANNYGRFYKHYDEVTLKNYLSRFHLEGKRKYKALSTGEKLKFAFAFALSHNPRLLLLDEPSANFDVDFREEFHMILREFTSDGMHSVFLSTHIISDVEQFADYILFLKNGRQLIFGDVESIRESFRMVSGEPYKIKLLKDKIVYMEEGKMSCNALVRNGRQIYDTHLSAWEPSIEELMYYLVKGERK